MLLYLRLLLFISSIHNFLVRNVYFSLRIAKVLDQQIRTKTWNSLREIYFFSQQKKVPFGKGGGSQYGLTSPG